MQVNGLIVEELNIKGELKSFVLNQDSSFGDLWIAFPDEYSSHRDGAFHFLSEGYKMHYRTVYDGVKMRKVGTERFFSSSTNKFTFKTNWDNIPVHEGYEAYYYALYLPKFAVPQNINYTLSVATGWNPKDLCKLIKDGDRYIVYIMCKGSEDRYSKPPQNLKLTIDFEYNESLFRSRDVKDIEKTWDKKSNITNKEFLNNNHVLEDNQYGKFEKLLQLVSDQLFETQRTNKLSQVPEHKRGILFLSANPINTSHLRIDEEFREINNGLRLSDQREHFTLSIATAVRPNDLRREILRLKPEFLHFSGHGEDTGIILEQSSGDVALVSGEALSNLFELVQDTVKCVILNSCYSENQAKEISKHIPYVIGMNNGIPDKAAIEFAIGFYDAIGAGRSIEDAYKFGRNAVALNNVGDSDIPILISR